MRPACVNPPGHRGWQRAATIIALLIPCGVIPSIQSSIVTGTYMYSSSLFFYDVPRFMTVEALSFLLIHTFSVLSSQLKKIYADDKTSHPYRPIKCQSRLWPQRGTKSTGHIVVTTRYSDHQRSKSRQKTMRLTSIMAPTKIKTVRRTYSIYITYREQPRSTRIVDAYPRPY